MMKAITSRRCGAGGALVQVSGHSNHRWIRPVERIAGAAAIRHVEDGHTRGKAAITCPPFASSQTATTHHETHRS